MHFYGICFCKEGDSPFGLMLPYDENSASSMVREVGEETCAEDYETDSAS